MKWCIILLFIITLVNAAPVFPNAFAVPPTLDAFYKPYKGFESAKPGTILKQRSLPAQLRGLGYDLNIQGTWQFLIRSTDSRGNATVIVTTVLQPYNADPNKVVQHHIAEDAASPNCAPSYIMQDGAPTFSTLETQAEYVLIQSYLLLGWYVVVPDYEGLTGSFTVGRQAGLAALDSLRAAYSSSDVTGLSKDAEAIFFGYSGGSIPSAWGASMQKSYAPDLEGKIIGVALGGWVTNLTAVAETIDGGIFAGFAAAAINGLLNEYPDYLYLISKEIVDAATLNKFLATGNVCLIDILLETAFDKVFSGPNRWFKSGWGVFDYPEIQEILIWNTLGLSETEVPLIPFYVFQSLNDEIAPYEQAVRVYNNWCAWGMKSIDFNLDHFNEHISEVVTASQAGLNWMISRFNGTAAYDGCRFTDRWSNAEIPGFFDALGTQLGALWTSFEGDPLGPANSTNSKRAYDRKATVMDQLERKRT